MRIYKNISYGDCEEQVLDVYIPTGEEFPVFVYFHGGGLEEGDKTEKFILDLVERGIGVVSANYRMYPNAVYPEFIEDGAATVAWAKENIKKYGNVNGFYVGGSSAGAYISLMLCFNRKYLAKYSITNKTIDGYYHNAGQPTVHFNVLKELGLDERRIVVDEKAPLYYVDDKETYPYMEIAISDNDIENRYEQTMLLISTLKHFRHDMEKITLNIQKDSVHCACEHRVDKNGRIVFANMIYEFIKRTNLLIHKKEI